MVERRHAAAVITILVPPGAAAGDTVELDPDEAHHLRVRRADDATAGLRDGVGLIGEGVLARDGRRMLVRVSRVERVPPPAPLVVAVGAGDRERFALLAEKAAELGVTRIVPLETERARSVAGRVRAESLERIRRRALEAIKQCGSAWAPEIAEPISLEEFLAQAPEGEHWLADADGTPPPVGIAPAGAVAVVVGPEGGLTPAERGFATKAGYVPVTLSAHTLRFETAAIAAAVAANLARRRGAS